MALNKILDGAYLVQIYDGAIDNTKTIIMKCRNKLEGQNKTYYLLVDSLLIRNHKLEKPMSGNQYLETIILSLMILMVIGSLDITGQEFIYFQF